MRISDWSSDVCSSDLGHILDACGANASCAKLRPDFSRKGIQRGQGHLKGQDGRFMPDRGVLGRTERSLHGDRGWPRQEERRGGKEWGSTCRSWWSPQHTKKKNREEKIQIITIE